MVKFRDNYGNPFNSTLTPRQKHLIFKSEMSQTRNDKINAAT